MADHQAAPTWENFSSQEKVSSLQAEVQELRETIMLMIAQDRQRIAKLESVPRPKMATSQIREARIKRIDFLLMAHNNQPMTFADMGKLLGYRSNTRRQNMTNLAKRLFEQYPDRYEVRNSKLGGKTVRLVPDYLNHLLKGGV